MLPAERGYNGLLTRMIYDRGMVCSMGALKKCADVEQHFR